MKPLSQPQEVLFLTSYPPTECGIATYSKDLINAVHHKFSALSIRVCALEGCDTSRAYPEEVKYVLKSKHLDGYIKLAHTINKDESIKMILIQHEFGLFGGHYGEYLLQLLYSLEKPVSIVFHTTLPYPDEKLRIVVQALGNVCDKIVVMTKNSSKILQDDYKVPENKIEIIPHGTHLMPAKNKLQQKRSFDLQGRMVLSSFGLLSSNKCIETALDALPTIVQQFPDVIYLILGRTHPDVVNQEGEMYRQFLEKKVIEHGLERHVRFINKYLTLTELLEYLNLTDIYLFTSKDRNQAVSGTLAYAMGAGSPVIATPIPHAMEMLQDNAGIIIDFEEPKQLAQATIQLLANDKLREEMGRNALHQTRASIWDNTALAYARLFNEYLPSQTISVSNKDGLIYNFPDISLKHIRALTDNVGMIQFSDIDTPDIKSGYTLDDNARALIAICMYYDLQRNREDLYLIRTYLNFIEHCQQANGRFLNYVDENMEFHIQNNHTNLEDSSGRALWGLGLLLSYKSILPVSLVKKARRIFEKSLWWMPEMDSPRAMAFAIKGLYHYNLNFGNKEINNLIEDMANKLLDMYNSISDTKWRWFEEYLTYANSSLPEAMLYAYIVTKKPSYKMIARITFEFLLSHLFTNGTIKVISNRGWYHKDCIPNKYGEQPIDVSYTIQALELFYLVFRDKNYLEKMETAFTWFLGNNHVNQIIYNPVTGGCYDGLEENHVNLNQGAESTVCYLMARLTIERVRMRLNNNSHLIMQKQRV